MTGQPHADCLFHCLQMWKLIQLNVFKRTWKIHVLCLDFVLDMRSHRRMSLTGSSPSSMNGSIVACSYLDHVLNVAAGFNTLCFSAQDGDNPRPKKKKKLMKKKTKRKGEDIQRYHSTKLTFNTLTLCKCPKNSSSISCLESALILFHVCPCSF